MTYPTDAANQADYLTFIRDEAGISVTALPDTASIITTSFLVALETVNTQIAETSQLYYNLAAYNLALDYLINWAPDQVGQSYFKDLRAKWKLNSFVAGVVQSSADESTSESLLVPDTFKALTLSDLQNLKTPYGRAYLAIAQKVGSVWGLS